MFKKAGSCLQLQQLPRTTDGCMERESCAPLNQPHLLHPLPPMGISRASPQPWHPQQPVGASSSISRAGGRASSLAFIKKAKESLHPKGTQKRVWKNPHPGSSRAQHPGDVCVFLCSLQGMKPRRCWHSKESSLAHWDQTWQHQTTLRAPSSHHPASQPSDTPPSFHISQQRLPPLLSRNIP